jgi:hypothetical protein
VKWVRFWFVVSLLVNFVYTDISLYCFLSDSWTFIFLFQKRSKFTVCVEYLFQCLLRSTIIKQKMDHMKWVPSGWTFFRHVLSDISLWHPSFLKGAIEQTWVSPRKQCHTFLYFTTYSRKLINFFIELIELLVISTFIFLIILFCLDIFTTLRNAVFLAFRRTDALSCPDASVTALTDNHDLPGV